jgi:phage gpG-like protein
MAYPLDNMSIKCGHFNKYSQNCQAIIGNNTDYAPLHGVGFRAPPLSVMGQPLFNSLN